MKTILCISLIFCLTYTTAQKPIKTLTGHSANVYSVNYSPDGKYLASGSGDNSIKIWVLVISERVRMYVEEKVTAWQQKGEYEKTTDYQLRVNEQTRQKKIEALSADALALFKEEEKNNFKIGACSIKGNYDADNESFLLDISPIGEVVIKVPLAEAPSFKQDFNNLSYKNPDFIIKDDYFVLSKLSIVNSINGKSYQWSSSEGSNYSLTNIQYNFAPIDNIKIPDSSGETGNKQNVTQTTISVGESDVDINIPVNSTQKKTNTYALIIGNEDYSSFQTGLNTEVNVDYAINDAKIFKEYCNKTLGIPEKQIKLLTNATLGQMNQGIAWLNNLAKVDNGNAELIFYYSGHGLPDEQTKESYLMPVDISGTNIAQAIKLTDVYNKLNENPAKKVSVFLDACFSGGARNQGLIAMKGVKINPEEVLITGNMVVFSSSSGDESSGVYREQQHGFFTYFLLKKLQESKGNISYKELSDFIIENVKKETALSGKIQTPQVSVSSNVENVWSSWKIK